MGRIHAQEAAGRLIFTGQVNALNPGANDGGIAKR
jgi:hypothetical protein